MKLVLEVEVLQVATRSNCDVHSARHVLLGTTKHCPGRLHNTDRNSTKLHPRAPTLPLSLNASLIPYDMRGNARFTGSHCYGSVATAGRP